MRDVGQSARFGAMALVAGTFGGALLVMLSVFVLGPTRIHPLCIYADGESYCAIARGERVSEPFNSRPLVPLLAGALPGGVETGFELVAGAGIVAAVALSAKLADRLVGDLGGCARVLLAVAIVSSGLVRANGLRDALSVPVFVDQAALAFGLGWLVLFTSRDRDLRLCSVPIAVAAVAAREIWVVVIVVGALIVFAYGARAIALANAAAAAATFVVVPLLFPPAPRTARMDVRNTLWFWWHVRTADSGIFFHTIWAVVFAVGLLPVILLSRSAARWVRREHVAAVLLAGGLVFVLSAPFTGSDLWRLAYPGGVMLTIAALAWAARSASWASVPLAVGSVILWGPARGLLRDSADYGLPLVEQDLGIAVCFVAVLAAATLATVSHRRMSRSRASSARLAVHPSSVRDS